MEGSDGIPDDSLAEEQFDSAYRSLDSSRQDPARHGYRQAQERRCARRRELADLLRGADACGCQEVARPTRRVARQDRSQIMPLSTDLARRLIVEAREDDATLPDESWEVWTSNSFRRIKTDRGEPVLYAMVHQYDGHPDLSMPERPLEAIARTRNNLAAMASSGRDRK